jgi:hypothetical protein
MKRKLEEIAAESRYADGVVGLEAHAQAEKLLAEVGGSADDADDYADAVEVLRGDSDRPGDALQDRLDDIAAVAELAEFRVDELGLAGSERALLAELETVFAEHGLDYYDRRSE